MTALPPHLKVNGAMTESFDPYRKWLGIPPKDQPPHHYRLLGIATFEDDPDVIENAASRQMAHVRTFQTSKQHGPVSQRMLTELSAAKVCLLTPDRKAAYDEELRARLASEGKLSSADLTAAVAPADEEAEAVAEPDLPPLRRESEFRWRTGAVIEAVNEPPPVPIPMPPVAVSTAVAAPAFPGLRRVAAPSVTARTYRKNSSALPMVITVASLLGLAALGAVAYVVATRPSGSTTDKAKSKTATANTERPATSAGLALTTKLPAEQTGDGGRVTAFPVGSGSSTAGSGANNPFPVPAPAPAAQSTAVQPLSQFDRNELGDRMRQALFLSEQALADRQDDEFRQHFALAEQLAAHENLPERAGFQEKTADLRVLRQLNDEFWAAVRDNLHNKLELGERIEFHQHKFELLAREGEMVEYFLNGEKHAGEIRALEPRAAILVASKTIKWEDPVTFLPVAAFLSVDAKVTDENERKFGKQLFAIGRLIGKANPALARKFGLKDINEEIKLDEDLSKQLPALPPATEKTPDSPTGDKPAEPPAAEAK